MSEKQHVYQNNKKFSAFFAKPINEFITKIRIFAYALFTWNNAAVKNIL